MLSRTFRVSVGLVTALAVAVLCNVYLVFLLWSGGQNGYHNELISRPVISQKEEVPINSTKSGLNLSYLKAIFNSTTKTHTHNLSNRSLSSVMNKLQRELKSRGKKAADILSLSAKWVSPSLLIPSFTPELGDMIKYLQTAPIIRASIPHVGTQLKVMLTLEGGQKALLKPQWYNREHRINGPDVYSGADRHNGEIIGFYLSLLLDLRRTPVAVGRMINLTSEILANADSDLAATFFRNNQSHTCFYGVCRYCKPEFSVCAGEGDLMEAAIILWLPSDVKLKSNRSPWQRTYKKNVRAQWETDDKFCSNLQKQNRIFAIDPAKRRLLDLIDAAVFDFLISNGDRHHYEVIDGSSDAAVLLLDNGKSFGRPDFDYIDILAPLYQCCVIRKSTYNRLEMVESGPLGALIEKLTLKDSLIGPLLTNEHVQAINRRLGKVIQTIELCAKIKSWDDILVPY
ncbi:glycosaminoglycan xylosylkinase-like [Daphnia carinata]|uniref:glycosaminoglycan xylosylkinase-like n=1 Tax=Daphnia carinata TaxID=120202 RepID=UPI00257C174F|nr:glycosaminoglycan xylosylkinase-like [Daphnia carinata]